MNRLTLAIEYDNELLANKFQEDVKMYNAQLKGLRKEAASITATIDGFKNAGRVLD